MPTTTVIMPLACGHEVELSAASSSFDFPDDPLFCESCDTLVQFPVDVQNRLYGEMDHPPLAPMHGPPAPADHDPYGYGEPPF